MKKLVKLIILALFACLTFSPGTVFAVEPNESGGTTSYQCTVRLNTIPVYSNTKFNVTVTGSSANKTYRAYLRDRNRTISDNYTRQQQSGVALTRLNFGPFNSGGYLDPNLSPYEVVVDDITNSNNTKICGTTGPFTVRAVPTTSSNVTEGTCSTPTTDPTVTSNNCASGYSPYVIVTNSSSPEGPTSYSCECVPSEQIPTFNSPSNNTSGSTSHGQGFGGTNYCKDGTKGVDTALGCLPSDPGKLANVLFSIALGIAGAIAIIMIIIGGFKVAASQGNVDALQDGKDTITKAITGLVFILLATTILGIIGIDILGIPFFRRDGAGIIINQR